MQIECGDRVKYFFPEPENKKDISVTGIIEDITDLYVFLRTENNVKMKISYKNFDLIRHLNLIELQEEKKLAV